MQLIRTCFFLVCLSIIAHPSIAQSQPQLDNQDFENWTDSTYHHLLDGYHTNLFFAMTEAGAQMEPVVKVPGKNGKGSAVRMQNVTGANGNIASGIIYNTNPASFNNGGQPYNGQPTAVNVVANYDLQGGDTAQIYLRFKKDSVIFVLINLTGNSGGYTTISRNISLPFTPDTVKLTMASALFSGFGKSSQSWLEVDSIYFDGTTEQLKNNGFNQWTDVGTYDPDNWDSPNKVLNLKSIDTLIYSASRSTDAVSGNYALRLTTDRTSTDFPNDQFSTGFIVNGHFDVQTGDFKGVPFAAKPEKLTFHYKNAPQGNDTAIAAVLFTRYTNGSDSIIAGRTHRLPVSGSYQKEELEIDWSFASHDPDSVTIVFSPGNLINNPYLELGSTMWVDNVLFEYSTGIQTTVPGRNDLATIFPNPAGAFLYFELKEAASQHPATVTIYNINGRPVEELTIRERQSIDLSQYAAGTYLYRITSGNREQTGRFIVE